uniref:Immunoglobulin superfamily, member 5a n=1 Tax=Amphiprion percula TaxID=161767 RepID=A0A3P8SRU2_AMPPE
FPGSHGLTSSTSVCYCVQLEVMVSEEVQLEPLNSTVLEGSDVRFNATVVGTWQIMTWTVQEFLVLTVDTTGDITPSSEQFSARFCSSDNSCVEFTIHNVTRSQSGSVTCTVQGSFRPTTAKLYVQGGVFNIYQTLFMLNDFWAGWCFVEFQCVTTAWFPAPTISWTRNGAAVNSSLFNTTSMTDGDSFNSTSILQFQAVSNTTVTCLATVPTLPNPQSSSVFLEVGKKVLRNLLLLINLGQSFHPEFAPFVKRSKNHNLSVIPPLFLLTKIRSYIYILTYEPSNRRTSGLGNNAGPSCT